MLLLINEHPIQKKKPGKKQRILQRAEYVIRTMNNRKYSAPCVLRYARKHKYETLNILRVLDRLRKRRQDILHAAWIQPLNFKRWWWHQKHAKCLQNQLEDLIVEFYALSGDVELMHEIQRYDFVSHHLLGRMVKARLEKNLLATLVAILYFRRHSSKGFNP
jgi:hypothetical protein